MTEKVIEMFWDKSRGTKASWLSVLLLSGVANAQASNSTVKMLAPYEGLLTKGCIGLLVLFVGLVAWEVVENKRASRSSLDIAKLAAAAAKKKSSASAPASGALDAPASRSFAPPPPPPPPSKESAPPPPPSASAGAPPPPPPPPADNPFASAEPAGQNAGVGAPIDSTVAFTPPDAGSSGGWADLLQRVRAGEPEAASFSDTSPAPSTEGDQPASPFATPAGAEAPPSPFGAPVPDVTVGAAPPAAPPATPPGVGFASPPANPVAAEPSASSEAWEALLKRTTSGSESPMDAPPSQDSGRISLGSNFAQQQPTPDPAAPSAPAGGAPAFQLPQPGAPAAGPPDLSGGGFQSPSGGGSDAPTSSFSLPGASEAPTSSFSMPGAAASSEAPGSGAPSFKLPGGEATPGAGSGGFQMPSSGANPFDGGIDDPSSTLPLSDMFSSGAGNAPPSFQLPSLGGSQPPAPAGGNSPFDFSGGGGTDGAGRTISLDFSQGAGQIPPPPQPKTEG